MKELDLTSCIRRKKYNSYRGRYGKVTGNVLNRQFRADKPNQKWVTDVTEFKINGEKLYLSPVLDLYNGEIVAYQMECRPLLSLVDDMLSKAVSVLGKGEYPLLHSDQGWQYQMVHYQNRLKEAGLKQSMSRKGNCHDNAVMESFFGTLKSECFYLTEHKNISELRMAIDEYIHYYNHVTNLYSHKLSSYPRKLWLNQKIKVIHSKMSSPVVFRPWEEYFRLNQKSDLRRNEEGFVLIMQH